MSSVASCACGWSAISLVDRFSLQDLLCRCQWLSRRALFPGGFTLLVPGQNIRRVSVEQSLRVAGVQVDAGEDIDGLGSDVRRFELLQRFAVRRQRVTGAPTTEREITNPGEREAKLAAGLDVTRIDGDRGSVRVDCRSIGLERLPVVQLA